MSLRQRIAYWLLGTDREEIRRQFRRVERDMHAWSFGAHDELKNLQGMLGIDWARKPEPYNVDDRTENYLITDEAESLLDRRRELDVGLEPMLEDSRKTNNSEAEEA